MYKKTLMASQVNVKAVAYQFLKNIFFSSQVLDAYMQWTESKVLKL